MEFSELRSGRLLLRALHAGDRDGYGELLSDPATHPYIIEDGPLAPAAVTDRIARNRELSAAGHHFYWALEWEEHFAGYVALHGASHARPALSYAVRTRWRRRGLAREAVSTVCHSAARAGKSGLVARTHLDNRASMRLLLAAGFEDQGEVTTPRGVRREFSWRATSARAASP